MNWENSSATKEEYFKMLSTMQIKNDCVTLKALTPIISQPVVILGMMPYLSLFCNSFQEYIKNIIPVEIKNDSPFVISDIRSKLKLFDERYGKMRKQILLSDNLQDQEFKGKLRFTWTRGLDIHYNLGVFFDEEGHIISNTQYVFYLFQDKSFSKSLQNPDEIRTLGKIIGTVINSVSEGLKDFLPDYCVSTYSKEFKVRYKDFNTNRNFDLFSQLSNGKEVTLRLLHILSSINFLRYIVMKITDNSNPWQLRAKYITFYYVVKSIERIVHTLDTTDNEEKNLSMRLKECISCDEGLFDSEFRSCMMHYGFCNNGKWAINDQYLDKQIPFFGLIESRFSGYSFTEYTNLLNNNILKLSDFLTAMLPFDRTGLKTL